MSSFQAHDTSVKKPFLSVGLFTFAIIVDFVRFIISGFVLMVLWNWFIPSIFPGVPAISYVGAIGLGLVAGYLLLKRPAKTVVNKTEVIDLALQEFFFTLLMGIFFLVAGFILHLFM